MERSLAFLTWCPGLRAAYTRDCTAVRSRSDVIVRDVRAGLMRCGLFYLVVLYLKKRGLSNNIPGSSNQYVWVGEPRKI